jgi:hypothetical protein
MSLSTGEKFGVTSILFIIIMCACAIFGWGMNIYKFASCDFKAPYKAEIVRGIGIPFAPVGAIVGWFSIADGIDAKANALIKDAKKRLEIK